MKAIIVELKDRQAAVMTEDGRFLALDMDELRLMTGDDAFMDISPGELIGSEIYIETDNDEDELSEDDLFDEEPLREILPDSEKQQDAGSEAQKALDDELQPKEKKNTAKIIPIRRSTRFCMRSYRKAAAAAAAAVIFTIGVGGAYSYAQPYGTVTLDVNPSIEYTINRFDRVLSVQAVNEDGAELLADLDLGTLRHRKISDAISRTLTQIDDVTLVVVGANTHSGAHSVRLKEELEATLVPGLKDETSEVYLAVASNEEAAEAKELGTTLGRLLFAQEMLEGLEDHSEAQDTETDFGNTEQNGNWTEWSTRPVLEIRREHDRRMDTRPKTGMDIPDHPGEARDDMGSPDLSEGRPGPDGPGSRENVGSPGLSAGGADQGELNTAGSNDMEADTGVPGEKESDMERAAPREAQPERTLPAEVPNEGKEDNQPFENWIPGFVGPASGPGSGDGPGGVGVTGHTDTVPLTEGNTPEGGFGPGAGSLQGSPGLPGGRMPSDGGGPG